MGNKANSINLLKAENKSLVEQILAWTLTIGRILVIITEAIALIAFLYRFGLDRQLVDLKDSIKPLQAYVVANKTNEDTYRDIQDRLRLIKKYNIDATEMNNLLQKVVELAKGKLVFNSVTVSTDSIKIDAITKSTGNMTAFINGLKTFPQVTSISVDKIENMPASAQIGIILSVTITKK